MSDTSQSISSDELPVPPTDAPVQSNHAPLPTEEESTEINRIDELISELGKVQLAIAGQLAAKNTELMEVEQRHAMTLNPKLIKAQELFDELQTLSDKHRKALLGRGKSKTYKRNVGSGAWRDQPRVELTADEKDVMATLRDLGASYSRPFIRRTVSHEVNLEAMLSLRFRERVATIPGVLLTLGEDFATKPNGGYRMSSAKPYWPALKDMPGPLQQDVITGE